MEALRTSLFSSANLIAYYRFESGALTTDSKDSKTLTNSGTVGEGTGVYGGCADFGATNTSKYFYRSDAIGISGTSALSINLWVKIYSEPSGTEYALVAHNNGSVGNRYFLTRYTATGIWVNNSGTQSTYTVNLGTSDWNMITFTRASGGTAYTYLNGVLVDTITNGAGPSGINQLTIGRQENAAANYLKGLMDDVTIFNTQLSAAQIIELYRNPGGAFILTQL